MAIGNTVKESMRDYSVYLLVSIGMAIITSAFAHNIKETRESGQWLNMVIEFIFVLMAAAASFLSMVKFVFAWSSDVFDDMDRNQNSYGLLPRTNPDASTSSRLPTSNVSGRGDSSATTAKSSKGKKGEPLPSTSGLQGTSSKSASASKAKKVESGSSTSGIQGASSTSAPASTARKVESGSSTSGIQGASSTSAPASTARKAESVPSTFELQGASSIIALTSNEKKEPVHSTSELQTVSSSSASEKLPSALTLGLERAALREVETFENQPMLPSTGLVGFLQEASEIHAAATKECVIAMPTDLESALAAEVQSISSGSSTEDFEVVHPHILQATATARELQESVKSESSDMSID